MFTGIVESMGQVVRLLRRGGGARLEIRTPFTAELVLGESVAVNGGCVTVTERSGDTFACDLVPETVARTNLGILEVGEQVNLERPVRAADRLGGHIVQGHVDAVGVVRSRRKVGAQEMLEVTIPFELSRYLAPQGSVALDGVSLTVVSVDRDRFKVALIPHTVDVTTLGRKGQGAPVNVEVDIISKYVERHMSARQARSSMVQLFDDLPRDATESKPQPAPRSGTKPAAAAPAKGAAERKPATIPRKAPASKTKTTSKTAAKRPVAKPAKGRR